MSLQGDNALVSAGGVDNNTGEAYYYRGLNNASADSDGTVKETLVLQSSDRSNGDVFGRAVSLDGDAAVIGASGKDNGTGAAYYYAGLNSRNAGETVTETVRLLASDAAAGDEFGFYVSTSESNAMVGARGSDDRKGAAYYYRNPDGAAHGGTATETVKLTASDGTANSLFGSSVSLSGTRFVIGANRAGDTQTGKVYSGDIRAFTTLDSGSTRLSTDGLSFQSQDDWIIGQTSSGNHITLSRDALTGVADVADITAAGKAVYIGQNAGANNNVLLVEGQLIANRIFIGGAGNSGNVLLLAADSVIPAMAGIDLAYNNMIGLQSSVELDFADLVQTFADSMISVVLADGGRETLTLGNAGSILTKWFDNGFTYYAANTVPEPAAYAALFGAVVAGCALLRRRSRRHRG